ncbi:hypothetical protein Dsin_030560 [Dipteronia sinensis]|uniref:Uncharacterized protein n=1 Tax=Dipteronia sinensis TaxID=43782 RepID=A0AAE0DRF8_9ROSI|nr:hypothetical protein Dsin_030560 [Dipteronia sinensis]
MLIRSIRSDLIVIGSDRIESRYKIGSDRIANFFDPIRLDRILDHDKSIGSDPPHTPKQYYYQYQPQQQQQQHVSYCSSQPSPSSLYDYNYERQDYGYYHQSPYIDNLFDEFIGAMFSDDNPNTCSIM